MNESFRRALFALAFTALFVAGCSKSQKASGPKPFGAQCTATEDCQSNFCVAELPPTPTLPETGIGICSTECATDADCPNAPNWGCASSTNFGARVCACIPDGGVETCGDGLDNDCNGLVDDCQLCNGVPVSKNDQLNCGSCGNACPAGHVCSLGSCECGVLAPTDCSGACADLQSDVNHCGDCNTVCAQSQTCVAGTCSCANFTAQNFCPGAGCVDFGSDPTNCGSCGNACPPEQTCAGGKCGCPTNTPDQCGNACVSFQSDAVNCGSCGNACRADQSCVAGACTCGGEKPDECAGACTAFAMDSSNCGSCGDTCPQDQTCISGACECTTAGTSACPDGCFDTSSDVGHCGGCGTACNAGEQCSFGSCYCASGLVCGGVCVPVNDPTNCGKCGTACTGDLVCTSGQCTCPSYTDTSCNGTCANLNFDAANCGSCGHVCPSAEMCSYGTCTCASGYTYCSATNTCVNTSSDPSNCGTCGAACRSGETCSYSACRCASGQWCASTGTCTNTLTDTAHCGDCTTACRSGETCNSGTCGCGTGGQMWCAAQGTCIDVWSSTAHCGDCTTTCHAGESCSAGVCSCPTYGQKWCASTGTCTDVLSSATHCGDCGVVCPSGAACGSGQCYCTDSSKTLCTNTCVDLGTDAKHCGSCGNACPGNLVCTAGACSCKDPVPGTAIRLTTTASNTGQPSAAWDGTHIGVAYTETTAGVTNLLFALLNPDGTRAKPTDTVVASYSSIDSGVSGRPYLTWSGTEYAVVWVENTNAGVDLAFRRLDATGAAKSATKTVSDAQSGAYPSPSIAWSSVYGGYAVTYLYSSSLYFRRIGTDGATPDAPNTVDFSSIGYFDTRARTTLVAIPDGRWGVTVNLAYYGQYLVIFNADGSRTLAPAALSNSSSGNPGDIAWDGSAFLAAYSDGYSVYDNRGMTPTAQATAVPGSAITFGAVALDLDQTVATLAWTETTSTSYPQTPWDLHLRRFTLPAGSTSTLTAVTSDVQVVTTETIPDPANFDLTRAGTTAVGVLWADNRWGAATELYYEKVDVGACP